MLTVERVKELAMQNYNKGGDTIVECYEDYQIEALIKTGVNTEKKLLDWFKTQYEIDKENRKAALWHAYGTTDEEEIKKMLNTETDVTEETEDDSAYESDFDDPCFGCIAFDAGYNCKHCPHGDDGHYSVHDVYRQSELL